MSRESRTGGHRARRSRGAIAALASLALVVSGCLSFDEPSPSPAPPTQTPEPTAEPGPRDPTALVIAARSDPHSLLPPGDDVTSSLLIDLLYDTLYRLDDHLEPQPDLAVALPTVSPDGLTWEMDIVGVEPRFQDGWPLTPSDVAFSLEVAGSPSCTLGRDLCDTVAAHLRSVEATSSAHVRLTLDAPFAPFLAEVLGQLPILNESAVRAGTGGLLGATAGMDASAPDRQVAAITTALNADPCLVAVPPFGCRLADHVGELEATLTRAQLPLPAHEIYTDVTGTFDAEAYAGALLDRVDTLGQVLSGFGVDQVAAALPLLDPMARPLGSGPYLVDKDVPGAAIELEANPFHPGGPPTILRIVIRIIREPAVAATMLATGDVDWLLQVEPGQLATLQGAPDLTVAQRPLPEQLAIVFNVRPGRIYQDQRTRQAFALCLDRAALAGATGDGGAILATGPLAAGSWAIPSPRPSARDVAAARALLSAAGWTPGTDGIMVQGTERLSSGIAVRTSRSDLLAFAQGAAAQLRDCGIELVVRDLDLTGDLLLSQLQWPNDFDTVLVTNMLGVDPDHDLRAVEGAHATTADNPADANPGGFTSARIDALIEAGRAGATQAARVASYATLQAALDEEVPLWPLWYDAAWAAISTRVQAPDGRIDPSGTRYQWGVEHWTLAPVPASGDLP